VLSWQPSIITSGSCPAVLEACGGGAKSCPWRISHVVCLSNLPSLLLFLTRKARSMYGIVMHVGRMPDGPRPRQVVEGRCPIAHTGSDLTGYNPLNQDLVYFMPCKQAQVAHVYHVRDAPLAEQLHRSPSRSRRLRRQGRRSPCQPAPHGALVPSKAPATHPNAPGVELTWATHMHISWFAPDVPFVSTQRLANHGWTRCIGRPSPRGAEGVSRRLAGRSDSVFARARWRGRLA
jgi:hypothetical protein